MSEYQEVTGIFVRFCWLGAVVFWNNRVSP